MTSMIERLKAKVAEIAEKRAAPPVEETPEPTPVEVPDEQPTEP